MVGGGPRVKVRASRSRPVRLRIAFGRGRDEAVRGCDKVVEARAEAGDDDAPGLGVHEHLVVGLQVGVLEQVRREDQPGVVADALQSLLGEGHACFILYGVYNVALVTLPRRRRTPAPVRRTSIRGTLSSSIEDSHFENRSVCPILRHRTGRSCAAVTGFPEVVGFSRYSGMSGSNLANGLGYVIKTYTFAPRSLRP